VEVDSDDVDVSISDVGDAPYVSSTKFEYFPMPSEEFEHFQQNQRPKFDYPKAERHREYTSARSPPHKHPKPTPKPRPRPKPWRTAPLPAFKTLAQLHLSFVDFVERLLTRYPHPHPSKKTWTFVQLSELSTLKPATQCQWLGLVCH
jgi:hypothetical protein